MKNWRNLTVLPDHTVRDVIEVLNRGGVAQIALITDSNGRLLGTVTDGDIRRGLLVGKGLDSKACDIMHKEFHAVRPGTTRESVWNLMREHTIRQVPVVNDEGILCGLFLLDDLIQTSEKENVVVIMAGGEGMRLRPLTEGRPKPMLEIGGRPLLESMINNFVVQGFHKFYVSINYLGDQIRNYFGDGKKFKAQIEYLEEDKKLGTAGALGLINARLEAPLIVMNADVLTRIDFARLISYHEETGATATVCLREYDMEVPYGVVRLDSHKVKNIEEKPVHTFFVNAGVYVLSPEVVSDVNGVEPLDMPELLDRIIGVGGVVSGYPIHEYWLDIGHHDEYERARDEIHSVLRTNK